MLKPPAAVLAALSWWRETTDADKDLARTILIVVAMFSVFWIVWILKSKKSCHPPLPPGPPPLPLVGNLLSLGPELHTYFLSLAKLYGPILTLHLGKKVAVVITSPALAREVLKINDTIFANRDVPVAGRVVTYGAKDISWSPYGDQWRMLRRICVGKLLSTQNLDSLYSLRRKEIRNTVKHLHNRIGSPVNIGELMFLTLWNVVTGMIWGSSIKAEDGESLGIEFRQIVGDVTKYLGMPNLSDFYPGLARFDLQGIRKEMKVLGKRFDVIFEKMIEEKRKKKMGEDGSKDFMEFLLGVVEDDGDSKTPFTITHLKALLMECS